MKIMRFFVNDYRQGSLIPQSELTGACISLQPAGRSAGIASVGSGGAKAISEILTPATFV